MAQETANKSIILRYKCAVSWSSLPDKVNNQQKTNRLAAAISKWQDAQCVMKGGSIGQVPEKGEDKKLI